MSYIVELEVFHGPLDLLLFLIEKNEVDIYDIPIAKITEQYLVYIRDTQSINIESLGDFLILASYLLNLKSKMLLPQHKLDKMEDDLEAEEDPREELIEKLLEYKKFKEAAQYLSSLQREGPEVFLRNSDYAPEVHEVLIADVRSLVAAYNQVLKRLNDEPTQDLNIPVQDISIPEKMQELLRMLYNNPNGLVFQSIFADVNNKREALAFFLALLELIRLQKISASQKGLNGHINISLVGEYNYDDEKSN